MAAGTSTHAAGEGLQDKEVQVLSRIVDAMLELQDTLRDADADEFSSLLRAACQRQKRTSRLCRRTATAYPR